MRTLSMPAAGMLAAAVLAAMEPPRAPALDLLQRYPTRLTVGDATPDRARPWQFTAEDVFRVSQFSFDVGPGLRLTVGPADIGIGHCSDGAVWAVVLPREGGKLSSSVAREESVANVWLRFHPAQIARTFPPDTVFADGAGNVAEQMRAIANAKFASSWHAGANAMIPEPKDMTVDVDTRSGARRFFMVDLDAKTAEYAGFFEQQPGKPAAAVAPEISLASAPPVVLKTVPPAGAADVDPGLTELRVTFSKPMLDGNWSWTTWGEDNYPETAGEIHYLADGRTCVLPVKLKAGKFYATWLNSSRFKNFQDTNGIPAVPYLLTFETRP